jgi:MFS family permease
MKDTRTGGSSGLRALEILNFFMADVQAGIGPFVGVLLQSRGWKTGAIGTVLTIGGIAGMIATVPAGALVDASHRKRLIVVVAGVLTIAASALLWVSNAYMVVSASQIATALAGAALGPAIAGMTLGMVGRDGFAHQFGRNQMANHAGNVAAAALSGFLGWKFGFPAVLFLSIGFGIVCVTACLMIPAASIDDDVARGKADGDAQAGAVSGIAILFERRPLLILGFALLMFHLGNAAMLPLYGLAIVAAKQGNPSLFTAETIVVAQLVMVLASFLAIRLIRFKGYWWVILISFLALPVRGIIAAYVMKNWGVFPVQALDGIGAGLQSVAVPALVAELMQDTGRVNVAQGAVMTLQGIGAALSPAFGGLVVDHYGYRAAFIALGAISAGSLFLWIGLGPSLRQGVGNSRSPVRQAAANL